MTTVAITGGSGFIGRNLYEKLSENPSFEIKILDLRVPAFNLREKDTFIKGDIRNKEKCAELLKNSEILIHLAAEHKDVGIAKEQYFDVNEKGTQILLDVCSEFKINKMIFTSSVAVYGKSVADDNTVPEPVNFYGKSKLAAEKVIEKWTRFSDNKALILRPTVVVGKYNVANIFNLVRAIDKGQKFFYPTTDKKIKSIVSVIEIVDIILHSMNSNFSFMESNSFTCNVVSYPQLSVARITDIICEELGMKKPKFTIPHFFIVIGAILAEYLSFATRRPTAINYERACRLGMNTEIKAEKIKEIGYRSDSSTEESLREMVRWYKSQKS